MAKILRQICRGCGDLPYVGSHPGTFWLIMFIIMGMVAGRRFGFLVMTIFCLPIYLYGAYERAEFSDYRNDVEQLAERDGGPAEYHNLQKKNL